LHSGFLVAKIICNQTHEVDPMPKKISNKGKTHGERVAAGEVEEWDLRGLMPESYDCVDCGYNTQPGCSTRAEAQAIAKAAHEAGKPWDIPMRIGSQTECYLVHDHVWQKAGMEPMGGCLCIGCLEKRLGRRLYPGDFVQDHSFFQMPGSRRMLERQGRWDPLGAYPGK
jgi:hypothetical protein